MPYEMIAALMFSTMMLMLLTGQRVFGAIGFVAVVAAFFLWGDRGGYDLGFSAAMKLMKWYPLADAADVHLHGLRAVGKPYSLTIFTRCSTSGWAGCRVVLPWAPSG